MPSRHKSGPVRLKSAGASLADQAYEAIKSRILAARLRPGQFLTEAELCEALQSGRTPVHQAVHRLSREGWIEIRPRKGLVIRNDSSAAIAQVIEARGAVEPAVAAFAARRIDEATLEQLHALLEESARNTDQRQRKRFMQIDAAFHDLIATAADNPPLAEAIRQLHQRSLLVWQIPGYAEDDLDLTQAQHRAILEAIAARDASGAARAMKAHLESLRKRLLKSGRL